MAKLLTEREREKTKQTNKKERKKERKKKKKQMTNFLSETDRAIGKLSQA